MSSSEPQRPKRAPGSVGRRAEKQARRAHAQAAKFLYPGKFREASVLPGKAAFVAAVRRRLGLAKKPKAR